MRLNDPHPIPTSDPAGADEPAILPAMQPAASPQHAKARAAAEKFEAFFIAEMMRRMRHSAREFGDGERSDRTGDDMLDLAHGMVADVLAGQHAFGVADLILRQVLPTLPAGGAEPPAFKSDATAVALDK